MWYVGLLYLNKLKSVLVRLIQHHPVLRASTSDKLKYTPIDYYTHYDHIKYVWEDRRLGPHNSVHKWVK